MRHRLLYIVRRMQAQQQPVLAKTYQFYDIAANLTDHQFTGDYYGKKHHEDDRHEVIGRAKHYGCEHLLVAAGNL